ncbi:hypothetical protein A9308_05555 [Moraxella atlantae]|uniref:OmpA-like domain-containing protein n=1 Tax=Faucicola atlantae TaxID=34059 RepID=A0A1B8QDK4_9GAMM|nr:OmpA family protein [Moraxella atlantae]OBX79694.1 hypothetical protein A9308_05555 [Moraxella atlantae]
MNIIEHLNKTVTPAVLGANADANRSSLLEKLYAIIVARLADDNTYNSFGGNTVANDDAGFFDRFLPDSTHRGNLVQELSRQSNVPAQEAQSLISRATPMVYNELRNLAGTSTVSGFLGNNLSSVGSALPTWSYALIPAGALGLMNIKHDPANQDPNNKEKVVKETTRTEEHLVATPKPEEEGGMGKILLPLIGLIILGLLAWWLLRSCNKQPEPVTTPVVASAPASAAPMTTDTTTLTASDVTINGQDLNAIASAPASDVMASTAMPVADATVPPDDEIPAVISETEPSVYLHHGQLKFYFAVDKDDISPQAQSKVGALVAAAQQGKKLGISGYTDSTGSAAHNEDLAKRRAEAVKKFLMDNGIPESQLVMEKPADTVGATGNTQEGRRVEVYVVDGPDVVAPQ